MAPQVFIINGQMYERMRDGRLHIIRPNWKTGKYDMFPQCNAYGANQPVGLAGPGGQSPPFNPIGPITTLPVPTAPPMTTYPVPPMTTLPVPPVVIQPTPPVQMPLPVPGQCMEYVDNQGCLNVICRKSNGSLTARKDCSQAVNAPVGLAAPVTIQGPICWGAWPMGAVDCYCQTNMTPFVSRWICDYGDGVYQ